MKRVADSSQDAASGCEEGITAQQTSTYAAITCSFSSQRHCELLFVRTSDVASMIRKPLGPPAKGTRSGAAVPEAPVPKEVEETIVFCVAGQGVG